MKRRPGLVIDTNVVVSALLWGGTPLALLSLAGEGDVRLYATANLLIELRATLMKPKLASALAASERTTAEHIASYRRLVTLMRRPLPAGTWSRDPDDDQVIACALAAKADFIVTGDEDLLVLGTVGDIAIRSVAGFLSAHA
jgi:putative PIN family toxin of toxin-antitoxin system